MNRALRGFTLVELLVATAMLVVLAVLGWRGLDAVLRVRGQLDAQLEHMRRTQLAFAQMEADCANLADVAALGERTVLSGGDNQLVLVRQQAQQGEAVRLQVVRYRLKGGNLLRAASAGTRDVAELDRLWQRAMGSDDALQEAPLQPGVTGMAVRAWNRERQLWRDGANVAFDAPPGRPRTRPLEVGLEVSLGSGQGMVRKVFLLGAP